MVNLGRFYSWARPDYLMDHMSLDEWWIYFDMIPEEMRIKLANPREPELLYDAPIKDGKRVITR
jgi:hypothetical protein